MENETIWNVIGPVFRTNSKNMTIYFKFCALKHIGTLMCWQCNCSRYLACPWADLIRRSRTMGTTSLAHRRWKSKKRRIYRIRCYWLVFNLSWVAIQHKDVVLPVYEFICIGDKTIVRSSYLHIEIQILVMRRLHIGLWSWLLRAISILPLLCHKVIISHDIQI